MTRTVSCIGRSARSMQTIRSVSLEDSATSQLPHSLVKLPTIGATPMARMKSVRSCPSQYSSRTYDRSDDICLTVDNRQCHQKRHQATHLLAKRHSTGEWTSRVGNSHRALLPSERLRIVRAAIQPLPYQPCDVSKRTIGSSPDNDKTVDRENTEKCRRWIQTLPRKFSGLCRVLSVPDSSPGYDDVLVTSG